MGAAPGALCFSAHSKRLESAEKNEENGKSASHVECLVANVFRSGPECCIESFQATRSSSRKRMSNTKVQMWPQIANIKNCEVCCESLLIVMICLCAAFIVLSTRGQMRRTYTKKDTYQCTFVSQSWTLSSFPQLSINGCRNAFKHPFWTSIRVPTPPLISLVNEMKSKAEEVQFHQLCCISEVLSVVPEQLSSGVTITQGCIYL